MAAERRPLALPPNLSPDDLDALSELSIVLAKVRAGIQSSNGLTTATGVTPGGVHTHGQQLSFKDVPGATDGLKHKVQHARAQVRALPDMDRSVEEQNREIKDLQARIEKQRALLETLREGGVTFGKRDRAASDDKMEI
ncbi:RNA polymerase II transcription mediator complex subunit 9 [Metarhizium robertsii]|uniref:Mediator of RNA polymerase II transcription subunit 9 n=2 Tax=Metarhizium robertsii TaxID=568076 RepID=E9EXC2_METRA|nr:Mediator complex, subunit Med9 [Metarhizium robertsii ARSEF 23]EFY99742.1 Mediator complex, subunit Med9 [Metarhizium robertsii ARSEF 23]EXV06427.1 RNA polymerase II transcription mediator complex subunit 9 [Metarhizium robertsii]